MNRSSLTVKGQLTVPVRIRKRLGLNAGDRVGFVEEGDRVYLVKPDDKVSAAFGLLKAGNAVGLREIEDAIRERQARRGRR